MLRSFVCPLVFQKFVKVRKTAGVTGRKIAQHGGLWASAIYAAEGGAYPKIGAVLFRRYVNGLAEALRERATAGDNRADIALERLTEMLAEIDAGDALEDQPASVARAAGGER